jgi:two-component system chemotaxis sensor kinase CheA
VIEGGALPSGDAATLRERWEELAGRFLPLVGPEADITMTFAQHRELLLAVEEGASRGELRRKLELCAAQPVRSQLDAFAAHARALAERLGKTNVRVRVHADPGLRHDGRAFAGFWSAFIHAVRNVVDHGVDAPEARVAGNKSAEATIELAATSGAEGLTIELRDDGPGIDWSAVRHKAESLGAPASTDADLVAALFLDGLSTREVVSEVSGRGAGMGALRSACESLAGAVEVEGRPGAGTTLRFRFPPPPPGPISAGPRDPASTPARAS